MVDATDAALWFERTRTFPLWMYVRTGPKPCSSRHAVSAGIETLFLPPTLIPRKSTTNKEVLGGVVRVIPSGPYGTDGPAMHDHGVPRAGASS